MLLHLERKIRSITFRIKVGSLLNANLHPNIQNMHPFTP